MTSWFLRGRKGTQDESHPKPVPKERDGKFLLAELSWGKGVIILSPLDWLGEQKGEKTGGCFKKVFSARYEEVSNTSRQAQKAAKGNPKPTT